MSSFRWVERDGAIPWASRSPDIMPLYFFMWGHIKDIVNKPPVPSLDELKLRIVAADRNTYTASGEEHLEGN